MEEEATEVENFLYNREFRRTRGLPLPTRIIAAARVGNAKGVALLLDQGCDPDVSNESGWTALHVAAASDHDNVVKVLLKRGANVDAVTNGGLTPMAVAATQPSSLTYELLARAGANMMYQYPQNEFVSILDYNPESETLAKRLG